MSKPKKEKLKLRVKELEEEMGKVLEAIKDLREEMRDGFSHTFELLEIVNGGIEATGHTEHSTNFKDARQKFKEKADKKNGEG